MPAALRAPAHSNHDARKRRRSRLARWSVSLLLVAAAWLPVVAIAAAQDQGPIPLGPPTTDQPLRDPEFGVRTRHVGLEREVRMYQWQRAGQGYARVWSAQAIDSGAFAPGHDNPPFPLRGARWLPAAVRVDGKLLAPDVLAKLGRWREFRPGFSALPGNLAATFQPQGDGLGSAENPLAPRIGDLRINWRERVLPPLRGRVVLRDDRWRLAPEAAAPASPDPSGDADPVSRQQHFWVFGAGWWLAAGIVLLLLAALAMRYLRRR